MFAKKALGFTMVELMISLVVGMFALGAIYTAFQNQQDNYISQDQVAEMQQNIRATMDIMSREIRMAGLDETGRAGNQTPTPSSILVANADQLVISMDLNNSEFVVDPTYPATDNEVISFRFSTDVASGIRYDADSDGIADAAFGVGELGRNVGGSLDVAGAFQQGLPDPKGDLRAYSPIAQNIHAIGFAYAFDNDGDGALDFNDVDGNGIQDPGEGIFWAIPAAAGLNTNWFNLNTNNDTAIDLCDYSADCSPPAAGVFGVGTNATIGAADTLVQVNLREVRAIRIWLLTRSPNPDQNYIDNNTYVVGRNVIRPNDNFRRRLLETVVDCRNMGLMR